MARIRTVKPEFFRHEQLQDLEREHPGLFVMLVFEALWCQSDSRGRFEWKPRTLKLDILPFLDFDLSETLKVLTGAGLVVKYEASGHSYGKIPTFEKHQRITGKEAGPDGEKYPDPPRETSGKRRGNARETVEKLPGNTQLPRKGKEGKGKGKEEIRLAEASSARREENRAISCLKGKTYRLTQAEVDHLSETYPAVDVPGEVRKAIAWLEANPQRRKTVRGMPRFLVGWMNRAQNGNGKAMAPARKAPMSPSEALAALHAAIESGDVLRISDAEAKCADWAKQDREFRAWPEMERTIREAGAILAGVQP